MKRIKPIIAPSLVVHNVVEAEGLIQTLRTWLVDCD